MSWLGALLLLLGPVVLIHELGHFLVAKLLGVKCERFAIGFGPALLRYRRGETEYVLGWLPFGGYVKMLGEIPGEELPAADVGRSLNSKPPLARIAIALAGPVASLLLPVFVVAAILMTVGWPVAGPTRVDPVVILPDPQAAAAQAGLRNGDRVLEIGGQSIRDAGEIPAALAGVEGALRLAVERVGPAGRERVDVVVQDGQAGAWSAARLGLANVDFAVVGMAPDGPAQRAGLAPGDIFLRLDGQPVSGFAQVQERVQRSAGQPLAVEVLRGGESVALELLPRPVSGQPDRYEIGVAAAAPSLVPEPTVERVLNPFGALRRGAIETGQMARVTLDGVLKLITHEVGMDAVAGPIGIGQMAADALAQPGWFAFLYFVALISVNLAIMNLLPIPFLDGGQIMLASAELVRGGPLSERVNVIAQLFGLSAIALLTGFAFWNDLSRSWPSLTSFFGHLL